MKLINCTQCGAGEFKRENGYMICKYCGAKYANEKGDLGIYDDGPAACGGVE